MVLQKMCITECVVKEMKIKNRQCNIYRNIYDAFLFKTTWCFKPPHDLEDNFRINPLPPASHDCFFPPCILERNCFPSPFWLEKLNQLTGFYMLETFLWRANEKANLQLHTRFIEFCVLHVFLHWYPNHCFFSSSVI